MKLPNKNFSNLETIINSITSTTTIKNHILESLITSYNKKSLIYLPDSSDTINTIKVLALLPNTGNILVLIDDIYFNERFNQYKSKFPHILAPSEKLLTFLPHKIFPLSYTNILCVQNNNKFHELQEKDPKIISTLVLDDIKNIRNFLGLCRKLSPSLLSIQNIVCLTTSPFLFIDYFQTKDHLFQCVTPILYDKATSFFYKKLVELSEILYYRPCKEISNVSDSRNDNRNDSRTVEDNTTNISDNNTIIVQNIINYILTNLNTNYFKRFRILFEFLINNDLLDTEILLSSEESTVLNQKDILFFKKNPYKSEKLILLFRTLSLFDTQKVVIVVKDSKIKGLLNYIITFYSTQESSHSGNTSHNTYLKHNIEISEIDFIDDFSDLIYLILFDYFPISTPHRKYIFVPNKFENYFLKLINSESKIECEIKPSLGVDKEVSVLLLQKHSIFENLSSKEYNKDKDHSKENSKDYSKDKDYNKYCNKDYSKEYSKENSKDKEYSKDYSKDRDNSHYYNKDYNTISPYVDTCTTLPVKRHLNTQPFNFDITTDNTEYNYKKRNIYNNSVCSDSSNYTNPIPNPNTCIDNTNPNPNTCINNPTPNPNTCIDNTNPNTNPNNNSTPTPNNNPNPNTRINNTNPTPNPNPYTKSTTRNINTIQHTNNTKYHNPILDIDANREFKVLIKNKEDFNKINFILNNKDYIESINYRNNKAIIIMKRGMKYRITNVSIMLSKLLSLPVICNTSFKSINGFCISSTYICFGLMTDYSIFNNSYIFRGNNFIHFYNKTITYYMFNKDINLRIELYYSDVDKYIALDISNNVLDIYILLKVFPRIYIAKNAYRNYRLVSGGRDYGKNTNSNPNICINSNPNPNTCINSEDNPNPNTCINNDPNPNPNTNYNTNPNPNYNTYNTSIHKKLQLFDTFEWKRASIKEVPFIKERYDLKIQIDCCNKENKSIINKIIEEKRKIPFNTQESDFIFYTLCYYTSNVYFSKVTTVDMSVGFGRVERCSEYTNPYSKNTCINNDLNTTLYSNPNPNTCINSGTNPTLYTKPLDINKKLLCIEIRMMLKDMDFNNFYYVECLLSRKERFISLQLDEEDIEIFKNTNVKELCVFIDTNLKERFVCVKSVINVFFRRSLGKSSDGKVDKGNMNASNPTLTLDRCIKNSNPTLTLDRCINNTNTTNNTLPLIRSMVVTPLSIIFNYPKYSMENRVLRNFDSDKFIRVSFREENIINILKKGINKDISYIYDNYRNILLEGFYLGNRKYFFLAMSSSQLKLHNSWFVTPYIKDNIVIGCDYIRGWMGNFSEIKNVGKYCMRLGQSLGTTIETVRIENSNYREEEDIVSRSRIDSKVDSKLDSRIDNRLDNRLDNKIVSKVEDQDTSNITLTTNKDTIPYTYCFTDGCGKISYSLSVRVSDILGLNYIPSAFQIRFKGYKGVVVLDKGLDKIENKYIKESITEIMLGVNREVEGREEEGYEDNKHEDEDNKGKDEYDSSLDPVKFLGLDSKVDLVLRPSMKKFESNYNLLEIISYSQCIPCYLNRQIIIILETLGIKKNVFLEMLDGSLKKIFKNIFCEPLKILQKKCNFFNFCEEFKNEMFFRKLLFPVVGRVFGDLYKKSKLFVDKGRVLIGVVDDRGILEENEIFVMTSKQCGDGFEGGGCEGDKNDVSDKSKDRDINSDSNSDNTYVANDDFFVVTSKCIVAKNPCLHPGDIRVVNAVNRKELYHLKNCVVFSSKGRRPVFNMCSGSDLDGDLYFVSWDERLIIKNMYEPDSYRNESVLTKEVVSSTDIVNFYIKYMRENQLGQIANTHLALSDMYSKGVTDERCLKLSTMFNQGVDFPKTGYVAKLPMDLVPEAFPDFMEVNSSCYCSRKVLGVIYRRCSVLRLDQDINLGSSVNTGQYNNVGYDKGCDNGSSNSVSNPYNNSSSDWIYCDCNSCLTDITDSSFDYTRILIVGLNMKRKVVVYPVGIEKYMEQAQVDYNNFKFEIYKLLRQFNLKRESELFVVLGREDKICYEEEKVQRSAIMGCVKELFGRYRNIFYRDVKKEEIQYKILSWYKICDNCREDVHSFPWILCNLLMSVLSKYLVVREYSFSGGKIWKDGKEIILSNSYWLKRLELFDVRYSRFCLNERVVFVESGFKLRDVFGSKMNNLYYIREDKIREEKNGREKFGGEIFLDEKKEKEMLNLDGINNNFSVFVSGYIERNENMGRVLSLCNSGYLELFHIFFALKIFSFDKFGLIFDFFEYLTANNIFKVEDISDFLVDMSSFSFKKAGESVFLMKHEMFIKWYIKNLSNERFEGKRNRQGGDSYKNNENSNGGRVFDDFLFLEDKSNVVLIAAYLISLNINLIYKMRIAQNILAQIKVSIRNNSVISSVDTFIGIAKHNDLSIVGMLDKYDDVRLKKYFGKKNKKHENNLLFIPVLMNKGICEIECYKNDFKLFLLSHYWNKRYDCRGEELEVRVTTGRLYFYSVRSKYINMPVKIKELVNLIVFNRSKFGSNEMDLSKEYLNAFFINDHVLLDRNQRNEYVEKKGLVFKEKRVECDLSFRINSVRYGIIFDFIEESGQFNEVFCDLEKQMNEFKKDLNFNENEIPNEDEFKENNLELRNINVCKERNKNQIHPSNVMFFDKLQNQSKFRISTKKITRNRNIYGRYEIINSIGENDKDILFEIAREEILYDKDKNINVISDSESFLLNEDGLEYLEGEFSVCNTWKSYKNLRLDVSTIIELNLSNGSSNNLNVPLILCYKKILSGMVNGNFTTEKKCSVVYGLALKKISEIMTHDQFEDYFSYVWSLYTDYFS